MLRFDRVKAREMLQFLYAGLFNLVTLGAIGADIYRVVDGTRREGGRVGSAGFVMLERLLGPRFADAGLLPGNRCLHHGT